MHYNRLVDIPTEDLSEQPATPPIIPPTATATATTQVEEEEDDIFVPIIPPIRLQRRQGQWEVPPMVPLIQQQRQQDQWVLQVPQPQPQPQPQPAGVVPRPLAPLDQLALELFRHTRSRGPVTPTLQPPDRPLEYSKRKQ